MPKEKRHHTRLTGAVVETSFGIQDFIISYIALYRRVKSPTDSKSEEQSDQYHTHTHTYLDPPAHTPSSSSPTTTTTTTHPISPSSPSQLIPNLRNIPRQQRIFRQIQFRFGRLPAKFQRQSLLLDPVANQRDITISGQSVAECGHHEAVLEESAGAGKGGVEFGVELHAVVEAGFEFGGGDAELMRGVRMDCCDEEGMRLICIGGVSEVL